MTKPRCERSIMTSRRMTMTINGNLTLGGQMEQVMYLRRQLEKVWSRRTTHPAYRWKWRKSNPSLGQCYVTSLVVQDIFGGELLFAYAPVGQVEKGKEAGDVLFGAHVWNRLQDGTEVDLTADQFEGGKVPIPAAAGIGKPTTIGAKRSNPRYKLLKRLLETTLNVPAPSSDRK